MSSEASEDPSFGLYEDEEEEEVSEVDSNDGTRIDWNSLTPPVWVKRNVTPEEHPFEEKKKLGRPKQHSALDLFLTFFTAELMQNICIWTKSHASTKNVDLELDVPLLRAFIGLSLLMGIVQKSDVKDYWSTDHEIATPFFPATMPRRTYLNILYNLHLHDITTSDPNDKLRKVRPFITYLNRKWASVQPGKYISVDESIIRFKGRIFLKQYLPKKRHRFGIKCYAVADSETGFIHQARIYCGKNSVNDNTIVRNALQGETEVLRLVHRYKDSQEDRQLKRRRGEGGRKGFKIVLTHTQNFAFFYS